MTKIQIYKKKDKFVKFTITGHTNSASFGQDILCAGISATAQATCLGIIKVLKINAVMEKNEDKGHLSCDLTKCTDEQIEKSQVLMKTLYESLNDISIGNEKYMKVEVYNEVY